MHKDIYQPPTAELDCEDKDPSQLASRWKRLAASVLDAVVVSSVTISLLIIFLFIGERLGFDLSLETLNLAVIALPLSWISPAIFFAINGKLLIECGQTLGKKMLHIKIVTEEGRAAQLKRHLLPRYMVYFLVPYIPVLGPLFSLVNLLCIFGQQKRCGHDFIASTKVVASESGP